MLGSMWKLLGGLAFVLAWLPAMAPAQVILVDRRPDRPIAGAFEVKSVQLDARVRDQVAEVQVSQTFHNPSSATIESEYLFPVPEDGGLQDMVLLVDGKELPGKLMDRDEARRAYEEIVRRQKDPALLEYVGRGLFRTSVFPIPPGADRTVTLKYTQLLKRDSGVIELSYPFGTQKFSAKPIERLELTARIESTPEIKAIYSPGHDVEIQRSGDHEATIRLVQRDVVPTADFRLLVTVQDGAVGGSVVSYRPSEGEDGYFLLLASPKVEREADAKPRPKTVLFVLDRSGSMSGKKIDQARDSLKFVLQNLRADDLFNVVVYDDRVESFKPELQRYDESSRQEAIRFVDNIRPGGSTNISEALEEALGQIQDDDRPSYVLFLTDGLPTAGETKEIAIAKLAREVNDHGTRLFCFGVGYDVNARLLDRLASQNQGTSEYVRPDEDIEAKVARFFARLTSPVLTSIEINLSGTDINRTYPRDIPDLFEGGQIAWVGRYNDPGKATVRISGKVGDERVKHTSETELAGAGHGARNAFVERLWAIRRIGDILDQIDLNGENKELVDELVSLSRKHGILTPYTAFLADEGTGPMVGMELRRRTSESLRMLSEESEARGVGQRLAKQSYRFAERAEAGAMMAVPAAPLDAAGRPGLASGPTATAPSMRGMGGMAGGGGSMMSGLATAPGQAAVAKSAEGRDQAVDTVRNVGRKTFYLRAGVWVDAELKPEEAEQAVAIAQFSDAYFALAGRQTAEDNQYLAFREPVIVRLGAQVYRVNPPAAR